MDFNKDNFLFKELVNTYAYTTASQNRDVYSYVSINGRRYAKYGTLQAVTFVGNLYNVGIQSEGYLKEDGPSNKAPNKYVLLIGMSKQHPCDTKVNKELGYEIAQENALTNPCMIIEIQGKFNKHRFINIIEHYMDNMKFEFIKTKEEILLEGKDPKNYDR